MSLFSYIICREIPDSSLPTARTLTGRWLMIDCDIHNKVPSLSALYPYLPEHWVDYCEESAFAGPDADDYPDQIVTSLHPDVRDLYQREDLDTAACVDLVRRHVLDRWDISIGILNTTYRIQSLQWLDLAVSMATAVNAWQAEEWLGRDARFRASLVVPSQNPAMAAEEVERWQGHPGFVQVVLPVRSHAPYGNRNFDPLFAAIEKAGLRVAVSFGGAPGGPPTGVGWPSTYFEIYAGMAQIFQSQVMSMVYEGLFDRFPDLYVVLLEAGFTWVPSLMWRMNKEWKGLRHNVPWVKRLPSEYIRQHFRWSLHPLDAGENPAHLHQILNQMGAEDLLLFATDYPHWHCDAMQEAIPDCIPSALHRKMCVENPQAFYRLP